MPRRSAQRFEQYFTSAHTRSHFLRHVNGRPHAAQRLDGRSALLRDLDFGPRAIITATM
jgi:hypothetical protein